MLKYLTRERKVGMMEYWNVDLKMMRFIYLILCQNEFYNNPNSYFPRPHYSRTPLFHYSNCERSELTLLNVKHVWRK
jgi:hypothetical protein